MESPSRSSRSSSPADERYMLESWQPEPLVPELDTKNNQHVLNPHVVSSKAGKFIVVDGKKCLNFVTHNYLGLADDPRLEDSSIQAVKRYGVGSCGPRAFYGTMDVHLTLEEELAEFLNVQESVLYAFGFSTIASAIPAYAKATDVVFVDELCNFAIQQGIVASKSRVIKFKHNDIEHLEQLAEQLHEEQRRKYGKTNKIRTFLIVEAVYAKTGDICPLKELIEIKRKYKIRLFIDESRSFGVLGSEGKGITQHAEVDINDVDLMMASLENAFCAYGGFCAGSSYVIDHQRLAGSGYCFSASLPPLQTQVALESLRILREEPNLVAETHALLRYAHEALARLTKLRNISNPLSPIKVLIFNEESHDKSEGTLLDDLCKKVLEEESMAITVARYLQDNEMTPQKASIRLVFNRCVSYIEIDRLVASIERLFSLSN